MQVWAQCTGSAFVHSERFQMTPTKFPNTPKPIFEPCSDGFPKPYTSSVSEASEVICFHEPMLAFQSNQSVNDQVSRQVKQPVSNPKLQFQPVVNRDMPQSVFAMHDPWHEDVDPVPFHDPPSVNVPTLLKVGEDPYDPWNPHVCDVEPQSQPVPTFGRHLEPKPTACPPKPEPFNQPVLLKAGEDIHDPWNICEQLHCFYNLQQPTLQSSSCNVVDPRNAL